MKVISWNVNGMRSLKCGIRNTLKDLEGDIICLQEVKATRSSLEETIINIPGYNSYFSFPKYQSGYSGVVTFCRNEVRPSSAEEGLSGDFISLDDRNDAVGDWPNLSQFSTQEIKALESEGRAIITKHSVRFEENTKNLAVINVYCPCADPDKPERGNFQLNFYTLLQRRAEELHKCGYYVLIVGDINTTRHPIDHCDPGDIGEFGKRLSRQWINTFVLPVEGPSNEAYFIDTFRHFHPQQKCAYTCWSTLTGARKTNYGTRIDYVLANTNCLPILEDSFILADVEGSDHCPVAVNLKCEAIPAKKCPSICTKYWPEYAGKQQKLTDFLSVSENIDFQPAMKRKKLDQKPKQQSITSFYSMKKAAQINISQDELCLKQQEPKKIISQGECDLMVNEHDISPKEMGLTTKNLGNCSKSYVTELLTKASSNQSSAWKTLLKGPPKPPKCSGHQEVCCVRTVQKESVNYGRQFFVCARPIGDSSNKDARCDYFQWAKNTKLNGVTKS